MEEGQLVLDLPGASATVETVVEIAPEKNTKLMGLYASRGLLCTQCEAEGFRRITFFPDRLDVLSRYRVRMSADKARFPVTLSNGNRLAEGAGWGRWGDPFLQPRQLFVLVAGVIEPLHCALPPYKGPK